MRQLGNKDARQERKFECVPIAGYPTEVLKYSLPRILDKLEDLGWSDELSNPTTTTMKGLLALPAFKQSKELTERSTQPSIHFWQYTH
jgi:hypothetical protein